MTKQTRQDLIDSKNMWKGIAITFIFIYIFMLLILIIVNPYGQVNDLEQELQSYQDNVEVWTLIYNCDWNNIGTNFTAYYEFTDYNEYQEQVEFANELNCNVIK